MLCQEMVYLLFFSSQQYQEHFCAVSNGTLNKKIKTKSSYFFFLDCLLKNSLCSTSISSSDCGIWCSGVASGCTRTSKTELGTRVLPTLSACTIFLFRPFRVERFLSLFAICCVHEIFYLIMSRGGKSQITIGLCTRTLCYVQEYSKTMSAKCSLCW